MRAGVTGAGAGGGGSIVGGGAGVRSIEDAGARVIGLGMGSSSFIKVGRN